MPADLPSATGGRRRPGRRSAVVVAIALACIAGIATTLVLTVPRMEPVGPLRLTNDATPTFELRIAHPTGLHAADVTVTIDGDPLEERRIRLLDSNELLQVRAPRLGDGDHDVRVVARGVGVLRQTLRSTWKLVVDTKPPVARIISPVPAEDGTSAYVAGGVAAITRAPMRLTVAAEPGTTLDVRSSAHSATSTHAAPIDQPRRTIKVTLPQGAQELTVTATDDAGNETGRTIRVLVDTVGPTVMLRAPRVVKSAALGLPISARDAHGVELRVSLDGNVLEDALEAVSSTPAPHEVTAPAAAADGGGDAPPTDTLPVGGEDPPAATEDDDDGGDDTPAPVAGRWKLALEDGAYEGRHVLEVIATDSLGTSTTIKRTLFVDSTEELGDATGLRPGARGRDVVQLHQALIEQEVAPRDRLATDIAARSYGAQTRAAVLAFQKREGMDADGVAGGDTIAGLTLEIVVDRGTNRLTLYRVGKVVKSWGIATGSSEFPTPTGAFEIQSMQENPTWTPPDSAWAKDAKVIPPGPNNPLGTRWMAISGTVGIHGTNNPASIGYSVSHGCIRMAIPDVEELYELVAIGTPVTVV